MSASNSAASNLLQPLDEAAFRQDADGVDQSFHIHDMQGIAEYTPVFYTWLMTQETVVETFAGLHQQSTKVDAPLRALLVDWLLQMHATLGFRTETLFLTVNILDRYLKANSVEKRVVRLVGIVALKLAAKMEETHRPWTGFILYCSRNAFSTKDALEMEYKMITSLAFKLLVPTAAHFMDLYQRANRCDQHQCCVVHYLLELTLSEVELLGELPSKMAAAATLLSNILLEREVFWPEAMAIYSGYSEGMLEDIVQKMRHLVTVAPTSNLQAAFRKFSLGRFGRVAVYLP